MLTEEEARRLVLAEIDDMRGNVEYDLHIRCVEALPFGWIFYWGAAWDDQNGQRPRLGGNGPYLVDRENGRLIANYERRLRSEAHARNAAAKRDAQQP